MTDICGNGGVSPPFCDAPRATALPIHGIPSMNMINGDEAVRFLKTAEYTDMTRKMKNITLSPYTLYPYILHLTSLFLKQFFKRTDFANRTIIDFSNRESFQHLIATRPAA